MTKTQKKATIKRLKAARGVEREQHFANGGDLVSWRGGTRTVTKNRKREKSRKSCRGGRW